MPTSAPLDDGPQPTITVAAGDATADCIVLWAHSTVTGPVLFRYASDPEFHELLGNVTAEATNPLVPVKVDLRGLRPGTTYHYTASNPVETARGTFRTPAAPGLRAGLRFGVSGDWRGELRPYPAIANVVARDLDFFVGLGDTIYADYPSPAVPVGQCQTLDEFRRKHAEGYSGRFGLPSWTAVRAATAWYAMIDDHEVTNDFSGAAPPASDARFDQTGAYLNETVLFHNGLQAFVEFNPIRDEFYPASGDEARLDGKRKLYRCRRFGDDAAMLLVDARSFRDPPLAGGSFLADVLDPGPFFRDAFTPGRTLLGRAQLALLMDDLRRLHEAGITWKFILVPEPIQNLGPLLGRDRFEGYALERTELLRFIDDGAIENVVFITADLHCTIVNNLTYQLGPDAPRVPVRAWEIVTGAVAFAGPLGPTVAAVAQAVPVGGPLFALFYDSLTPDGQEDLLTELLAKLLADWGYDAAGLDGGPIAARLLAGRWWSLYTYGWTEFDIAAETQQLTVTTYGVDWYTEAELLADPRGITGRQPRIVSQFTIEPR